MKLDIVTLMLSYTTENHLFKKSLRGNSTHYLFGTLLQQTYYYYKIAMKYFPCRVSPLSFELEATLKLARFLCRYIIVCILVLEIIMVLLPIFPQVCCLV